jgi:hypothetical protein
MEFKFLNQNEANLKQVGILQEDVFKKNKRKVEVKKNDSKSTEK